jgi:predicted HTH domain antitoxin
MNHATLPDQIVRDLEQIQAAEHTDQTATLVRLLTKAIRDWKLEHYAQAYGAGKISMARAAQESGVSIWEMMDYVRSRKISAQYDRDDLEDDLKEIYRRLGKGPEQ